MASGLAATGSDPFSGKRRSLSDYRDHAFGTAYGLLIKEIGLLARAVIVIDKDAKLKYVEIVPEIAAEPNYDGAFAAL